VEELKWMDGWMDGCRKFSNKELKEILKGRGKAVYGVKAELVRRLERSDRANYVHRQTMATDYSSKSAYEQSRRDFS
jgi:hypothetical protein